MVKRASLWLIFASYEVLKPTFPIGKIYALISFAHILTRIANDVNNFKLIRRRKDSFYEEEEEYFGILPRYNARYYSMLYFVLLQYLTVLRDIEKSFTLLYFLVLLL